jgi:pyruvate formate lyase activating enzyme
MNRPVLITEIQRFSINDGPGIRTNVFLKGCPLRCSWCHNPETRSLLPDLYWKKTLCTQCGKCLEVCPRGAVRPPVPQEEALSEDSTYHKIIRDRCDRCMACVESCPSSALEIVGKPLSVDAVLEEVERDRLFYATSGGGLTVSGGEPTLHADYASALLHGAHERGIHTCLDTSGYCSWAVLERLIESTDIVLFDVKHVDPELHTRETGVTSALTVENLRRLVREGTTVWVRIPVVPGYNDSRAFHEKAVGLLLSLPARPARIDLLPFHNWCQDKYAWLGIDWELRDTEALEPSLLESAADLYREVGFFTTIGGSGFEGRAEREGGYGMARPHP